VESSLTDAVFAKLCELGKHAVSFTRCVSVKVVGEWVDNAGISDVSRLMSYRYGPAAVVVVN
jgi:hypothetical protein